MLSAKTAAPVASTALERLFTDVSFDTGMGRSTVRRAGSGDNALTGREGTPVIVHRSEARS